jgi:NADH:ubiquinone oxidoreductase subunit B-like Fe-S oxidoreductase
MDIYCREYSSTEYNFKTVFMATMASTYDFGRFGSERLSFSPRQADLLMVMGTISKKM